MKSTIGPFEPATKTVKVTFEYGDVIHERSVNAVMTAKGKYDAKGTEARVAEVAAGVARKIDLGVITNPPPAVEIPVTE